MVVGGQIEVAEGRDGWLFLEGHGPHRTLKNAEDLSHWRSHMLPRLTASYLARHRRLAERGIPFLLVLAPEASGIYPEHLPERTAVESPTAAELLAEQLRAHGVEVILPSSILRSAKGAVDLYFKLDSHWSYYGAYLCYKEIVAAFQRSLAIKLVPWQNVQFGVRNGFGDLGVHARPERKGPLQTVSISGYEVATSSVAYDQREKNLRQSKCATGVGKALVFRDSYANGLIPFLERTFAETTLIAPAPTMLDCAIDHYAPDVVILEVAERALYQEEFAFADWDARTLDQIYLEQVTNPVGGKVQVEALAAISAERPADAIPLLAVAIATEGHEARVHNLAWALLNAGHAQLCLTLTRRFAPESGNRFLHYLQAQAAYLCGQHSEAIEALDRAIALQANNALYHYSKSEWLYRQERYDEAIAAALLSVRYAPLYERSWAILAMSAHSLGLADQAAEWDRQAAAIFGVGVLSLKPS